MKITRSKFKKFEQAQKNKKVVDAIITYTKLDREIVLEFIKNRRTYEGLYRKKRFI